MENTTEYLKNFSEWRNEKAKKILERGEPQILDEFTYLVPSQVDSNKKYRVNHIDTYSCECEDFKRRCQGKGLYCKHIKAIILFESIKKKYEVKTQITKEIELFIEKPQEELCLYCSCKNIIRSGTRKTTMGERQRYECKDCHKRFVLSPLPKFKGNAKLICLCMDCYYRGLSYRDISYQFQQFYGLSIHHETIRRWVLKFSQLMEKYSETIQPKIKGVWNADETLILTKEGKNKENTNYHYVWNVIDNKTKFLLASECSGRSRKIEDAEYVFKEALKQNGKMPFQVICDRNPAYQEGSLKAFKNRGSQRKVKFTSIVGKRKEVNNNAVENHNSMQKEFHKVRRGVKEVQTYQDGFRVFHNFIRKSAKQGLSPADKVGIEIQGNTWETLLLNSIKNSRQATGEENLTKTP